MKRIVIVGAGGLGRETAWLLREIALIKNDIELIGFLDDDTKKQNKKFSGVPVIGKIEWLLDKKNRKNVHAVFAIGDPRIKVNLVSSLKKRGVNFFTVVHPEVKRSQYVRIGEGSIIFPNVVMTTQVRVGNFVLINPNCTLSHDVKIGDYSLIGSGVHLSGNAKVGIGCEVGAGVIFIPGASVGDWSTIGAGAVVIDDIGSEVVAVGVPAKPIKKAKR